MNPLISRKVVMDLLPAYFSGEASAQTREIVETYLAGDPAFAERVRRDWVDAIGALDELPATLALPDDPEAKRALNRLEWIRYVIWMSMGLIVALVMPLSQAILRSLPFADSRVIQEHWWWIQIAVLAQVALLVGGAWLVQSVLRRVARRMFGVDPFVARFYSR